MKRASWAGLLPALLLGLATTVDSHQGVVVPLPGPEGVDLDEADTVPEGWVCNGTGGLHVVSGEEIRTLELPLKHTRVDVDVSGPVSRVHVTQTFQNPYEETIEAIYVFPLPHEAAVNDLEMRMGDRIVRGLIERREEARRMYEEARDRGQVAALLEQERPNVFTQSVANILPGNEIEVQITYVERLGYEKGRYELVFPTVVGPRFLPPEGGDTVPAGLGGGAASGADRVNPAFLPPRLRSGHDIEIHVKIDAGLPVRNLDSKTHAVEIARDGSSARVSLSPLDTIPNKDFVLGWGVEGDEPDAAVLAHHDGRDGYLTVLVHPELDPAEERITRKEMIFVLDCSGSMSGEPMAAAKGLARHALRNIREEDTFQIIRFSTTASGLSPRPLAATPGNVKKGIAYLEGLKGSGGTMMIEGIRAALDYPHDPDRLRIVMFLTDGYIGNENQILAAVRDRIGGARLFSFGVGSSVNRFLLERMAEEGRGEVQYFLPGSEVRAEVTRFYERVRSPYLTDVELLWGGVTVEDSQPARVADLFHGKPLVVHARYADGGRGSLRVRGKLAGRTWEKRIALDLPHRESGNPALSSLWARARVQELERQMLRGESPELVDQVTELGLRHRLVTRFTSFVAVEETMIVSDGVPKSVRVPVQMPEGVSYEGVFGKAQPGSGGLAQTLSPGRMERARGKEYRSLGFGTRESMEVPGTIAGEHQATRQNGPAEALHDDRDRGASVALAVPKLRLSAPTTEVSPGGSVTLHLEITNDGKAPLRVSRALLEGKSLPAFRVVDGRWNQTIAQPRLQPTGDTVELGAGETRTVKIVLSAADARFFRGPGVYHLFVDGELLGAEDSNRVTIRIAAR